jgi:hypothetical protein
MDSMVLSQEGSLHCDALNLAMAAVMAMEEDVAKMSWDRPET